MNHVNVNVRRVPRSPDYAIVRIMVKLDGKEWSTLTHQCFKIEEAKKLAKAVRLCGVWLDRALNPGWRMDCGEPHNYPGMRRQTLESHIATVEEIREIRGGFNES